MGDDDEPAFAMLEVTDEIAATDGYAFLGAVHELVAASRAATSSDLILAACCHALRSGGKAPGELALVVDRIWPGAHTTTAGIDLALELGRELGVVVRGQALDATSVWELTARGVEDVDRHSAWVDEVKSRAIQDLTLRARSGLGLDLDQETARLWLDRLVTALIFGIQESQDAYMGRVEELAGKRLTPSRIDQRKVLGALEDDRSNAAVVDFLKSCAVAAFDPLDTFGTDLVSHITIGCVLHSYVAGRDASAAIQRLGSPQGQRALIDTPVLLDLIGPSRVSEPARVTIRAAVAAGWEVVASEHSLEELDTLLAREIPKIKEAFTKAHASGVKDEWFASLAEDQLPSYCVEVLKDGRYASLDDLVEASHRIAEDLLVLGVVVRPHGNDHDASNVDRCRRALETDLARVGVRQRSDAVIQRDADSMAMVWRRRRRQQVGTWPGGWVVTTDRHLSPAYRTVEPRDAVPLTLSMAQWSTLLSATVPPADVVDLAEAAANQLVEEALWLLPARYPSAVALELARQLSPDRGGSEMDLRMAQISLEDLLDDAGEQRTASSLAADVLASRTKRVESLRILDLGRERDRRLEAERTAKSALELAAQESARVAEGSEREDKVKAENTDLKDELEWKDIRFRRLLKSIIVGVIVVAAAIFGWLVTSSIAIRVLLLLMVVATLFFAYRWCNERQRSFVPMVVLGIVDACTLAGVAFFLFDLQCRLDVSSCSP